MLTLFLGKSQDLKKDIEILSQTFERIIDRKEAIIKSLVKDIEEAEEQYEMALRSHLQNQDNLIGNGIAQMTVLLFCETLVFFIQILFLDLHQNRLQKLSEEFKNEQEIVKQEFTKERQVNLSLTDTITRP